MNLKSPHMCYLCPLAHGRFVSFLTYSLWAYLNLGGHSYLLKLK
jgi:hypothetical protein